MRHLCAFLSSFFAVVYGSLSLNIVDEEVPPALEGRICAYGDVDKDHYMDLIVQRNGVLVILSQSEQGVFKELDKYSRPAFGEVGNVFCSVGDFDGNAGLDILVSHRDGDEYVAQIFLFSNNNFNNHLIPNVRFADEPSVMDMNGDGMADVVGFVKDGDTHRLYCLAGNRGGFDSFVPCNESFLHYPTIDTPLLSFTPIFADLDGDLGAEIVFAYTTPSTKLRIDVWRLLDNEYKWVRDQSKSSREFSNNNNFQHFGGAVVSDFNADARLDILVPICREADCKHVTHFAIFSMSVWTIFQVDLKDSELVVDAGSRTIFRVGDFSLDGYPDLIATVKLGDKVAPMTLHNIDYPEQPAFTRRFELHTSPRLVMPSEMSKGTILLSAFFDLKEDGNLDILVEYMYEDPKTGKLQPKIDFIKCDDKGDTTFLKVQIFSNVCTTDCQVQPTRNADIGSGIAWHGACVSFAMSDSWGGSRISMQCQLPQSSHRTLYSAFALFGLGRSPNFVDVVNLGSPRWTGNDNQKSVLKQIVPNSRIIVVPPEGDNSHWQSRLYLTPSRLIFQSVIVLSSVCAILMLLVVIFHFRERRQDRKERQAQTHRFHFDAM